VIIEFGGFVKSVGSEKTMRTYSYRIKDGNVSKQLNKLAKAVNFVWNYCNETSYYAIKNRRKFERQIGIDLGLKDKVTCSDGVKYDRENLTKKYEEKLARYQRAHKKKQVKNLHAKIKNKRKDFSHKVSHEICSTSKIVLIGDVSSSKLAKTKMAKSVLDAGWNQLTTMLQYKAIRHGMVVQKVSEKWSTQTCSCCGVIPLSAPKGISALGVRNWKCSECEAEHDRDINSARNIFIFGAGHCAPTGSLSLQ